MSVFASKPLAGTAKVPLLVVVPAIVEQLLRWARRYKVDKLDRA